MDDVERERQDRASLLALARRVRVLRESVLTQEEFARKVGISVSFASLLERGERSPSYETLLAIARALEVSVAELFRDGPAPIEPTEPSHGRLIDFARKAHLTRAQVERFIAVGAAMFGLEAVAGTDDVTRASSCSVEGCDRPVLAKRLCASHYHRERRARIDDETEA